MTADPGRGAEPGAQDWRPGLPVERTTLAWVRTSLTLLGVCAAVLRLGAVEDHWWALVFGAAGTVLALAVIGLSARRYRRTRSATDVAAGMGSQWLVLGTVVAVVAAALAAVGLVVDDLLT